MYALENTLFVGKVRHHLDTLGSTNAYATDLLAKSNPSEGTVISARHQTAGRGQYGSQWSSEAGTALTFSVILRPHFLDIRHQFDLNIAVALGVYEGLLSQMPLSGLGIKWPNDIYVGTKKLGGILIQNTLGQGKINASVIGIGLNINQRIFPKNLPNPTSILLEMGVEHDVEMLLGGLAKSLEVNYLALKAGRIKDLRRRYFSALLNFGTSAVYEDKNGQRFEGKIKDVASEGFLIIEQSNGEIAQFGFKEIRWLFDEFPMNE